MSTSVDQAFVDMFVAEFHVEFQKKVSNLRGFVRTQSGVIGKTATWQRIGSAGGMVSKARHGAVPRSDVDHTPVVATLEDKYVAEDVDKLDLLKTNIDERAALVQVLSASAKRETDDFISGAMEASNTAITSTATMGLATALEAFTTIGENSAIEGGNMYSAISFHGWSQLLGIDSFANADFVGADRIPFPTGGMGGKTWLGALWFPMNGLPKTGDIRSGFFWNSMAVGHAIGADENLDIDWDGKSQSWGLTVSLSMAAVTIDPLGVGKFTVDESTALPT